MRRRLRAAVTRKDEWIEGVIEFLEAVCSESDGVGQEAKLVE